MNPSRRRVAIVQARLGSSRLPGKVLADLGGHTMLARVVRRVRRATLDSVVVATTTHPHDDPIDEECRRLGVAVFRGDEDDVLDRYHRAAQAYTARVVVRVTADCPFIDPALIDRVADALDFEEADYASNVQKRTYPRGLDAEAATADALARAWREAKAPHQRAHVMPFLYENPALFRLASVENDSVLGHIRWTVDTAEDFALARALYERVGNDDGVSWRQVLAVFEEDPALAALNRGVSQKDLRRC
jgi:spore coat polysaccharide biosynthesis protein SpsF